MNFCHFKYSIVLAACISGLSVISCGSTPKVAGSDVSPVYVTNSKKYYLIEPSKIEKEIDSYLALKGKFGVNEFTCLSMLQMNDKGVYLCLLSDFGTTLGELSYDGKKVDLECALLPKRMKGEYIVADLQFAFYRLDEISKTLSKIGLSVNATMDFATADNLSVKEVRSIMKGNKCIERITKTDKYVLIENLLRGYSYELVNADEAGV